MPAIDIGLLFIGWEDREDDNGSGVTMEDDDDTDVEAGEYTLDFLEVVLRQLWEGRFGRRRTTMKTTERSRGDEHEEDVVMRLLFEALCEGEPLLSSLSTALPKCQLSATTVARADGADLSRMKRSRTGRGRRQWRNGGRLGDDNNYE